MSDNVQHKCITFFQSCRVCWLSWDSVLSLFLSEFAQLSFCSTVQISGFSSNRLGSDEKTKGWSTWEPLQWGLLSVKFFMHQKSSTNWLKSDSQCTDWYLTPWRVTDCSSSSSVEALLKLPHTLPNLTPQRAIVAQMDAHTNLHASANGWTLKHTCRHIECMCVRGALGQLTKAIQLTPLLHTLIKSEWSGTAG